MAHLPCEIAGDIYPRHNLHGSNLLISSFREVVIAWSGGVVKVKDFKWSQIWSADLMVIVESGSLSPLCH